MLRSYDKELQH